jgi:hypothetical protein
MQKALKSFSIIFMFAVLSLLFISVGCQKTEKHEKNDLTTILDVQFTPVTGRINTEIHPVKLSDGKYYIMYELVLTNSSESKVTLNSLTFEDPLKSNAVVGEFDADKIKKNLHLIASHSPTNIIKPNETGTLVVNLVLDSDKVPSAIDHVLKITNEKASIIADKESTERIVRAKVNKKEPVVIGAPLAGDNWLAVNVSDNYGHRNAFFPINGNWFVPERWATDWIQLTGDNRVFTGDVNKMNSYLAYGQDLLAVKDARVTKVVDKYDDLKIGEKLQNMTLDNIGGNYVVLDIGDGLLVFYAHVKKGSTKVKEGDRVKKGQVIASLGNTGNSTMPHLHFHIVKGTSVIGGDGVPYVIDKFQVTGKTEDMKRLEKYFSTGEPLIITNEYAGAHTNEMPADLTVVNFSK